MNFLKVIALFIIAIAWANYTNLSTARSLTRAKEVGIRKVAGASRGQLMAQFILETVLINLLALALALAAVKLFLPLFGQITGTPMAYRIWTQQWFWLAVLAMFLAGVFLSGLYPVLVLSSFQPAIVLKGKLANAARGMNLRKFLVVFQFVMALGLLICTFTVFRQISFMKKQNLGFQHGEQIGDQGAQGAERIICAANCRHSSSSFLKTRKSAISASAPNVPGRQVWWDAGGIRRVGTDDNKNYQIVGIDYDYVKVFGLKFVAGRNFAKEYPADASALILNETAAKWLGFRKPRSRHRADKSFIGTIPYTVVGVLADYHQQSVKQAFEPHIFRFMPEGRDVRGLFVLKINTRDMKADHRTGSSDRFNEFFPEQSV